MLEVRPRDGSCSFASDYFASHTDLQKKLLQINVMLHCDSQKTKQSLYKCSIRLAVTEHISQADYVDFSIWFNYHDGPQKHP